MGSSSRWRAWRRAWRAFFVLAALAVAAGAVQHVAPTGVGYVLARVPVASACAVLTLVFLAERLGRGWIAPRALRAALLAGPVAGGLCFIAQAAHGMPDLRWLFWLELLPVLLLPLGVWGLQSRGLGGRDWLIPLACFALAESAVWLGAWDSAATGAFDGQALHHLALAASLGWLAWALRNHGAALSAGASKARATSLNTSR
jgi:hypothetical protein